MKSRKKRGKEHQKFILQFETKDLNDYTPLAGSLCYFLLAHPSAPLRMSNQKGLPQYLRDRPAIDYISRKLSGRTVP